jgi:hypothetical protein
MAIKQCQFYCLETSSVLLRYSLLISFVSRGSNPVRIRSPAELADMTLESRLVTYDWENHFKSFQEATRKGSFKPLCWMTKPTIVHVSGEFTIFPANKVFWKTRVNPQSVQKQPQPLRNWKE